MKMNKTTKIMIEGTKKNLYCEMLISFIYLVFINLHYF